MAGRPPKLDIKPGDLFGFLTILQRVRTPPRSPGGQRYLVKCVCGTRETIPRFYLVRKSNPKRHCGCKNVKADEPYTKRSWYMMHVRCEDPRHVAYKDYGGRGIKVCERWHKTNPSGWENFKKDMGPRPHGLSLDRIDPNGHYEPGNCRWATAVEQRANQRHNQE
jgi:hypothetical protein